MAGRGASHEDVKVVLIDTQYVETDPLSFKSVVQKLTGKDCCVAWIEESSFSQTKVHGKVVADSDKTWNASTPGVGCGGASMLTKGYSFQDLDRMILEAPPLDDEFKWLWAD
ncbi:hypothetical protein GQ457_03G035500 [Hibiscus cannabinus]